MAERVSRTQVTKELAFQRHADYYAGLLMTQTDLEKLELDFLQIALAVRRIELEEVASLNYDTGDVVTKYLELAGGFVAKQLRKLIDGTATKADVENVKSAIESVELGEVKYPANIYLLKKKLEKLQKK